MKIFYVHFSLCYATSQGWGGERCTDDVDECLLYPNICLSTNWSTCINNVGSFKCDCNDGFMENNNKCEGKNHLYG